MNYLKTLFVPEEIAIQLHALGFNEPCLGYFNTDKLLYPSVQAVASVGVFQPSTHEQITYFADAGYPTNSIVFVEWDPRNIFAITAPTYTQVFDWLHTKGLRIHDVWLSRPKKWTVMIYDVATGDQLWPGFVTGLTLNLALGEHLFDEKRDGWHICIEKALLIIKSNLDGKKG